jgi:hypothetical protein
MRRDFPSLRLYRFRRQCTAETRSTPRRELFVKKYSEFCELCASVMKSFFGIAQHRVAEQRSSGIYGLTGGELCGAGMTMASDRLVRALFVHLAVKL